MLEATLSALSQLFSPGPMLGMLFMLPIALMSGLLPGGGLPVAIILLGFTGVLDPWVALVMVVFNLAASDVTQPIPSILMGIPGSRSSQATILDGYPMAQRGEAGLALGASYVTTLVGGIIGAIALFAVLPFARELLRLFGSAEFFMLSLLGIIAVAIVSSGAFVKGLLTAALGMAIAMIGFSTVGASLRVTLGSQYLSDGIGIIPIVAGLFAIPEAIGLVSSNTSVAKEGTEKLLREAKKDVYRGMKIAMRHKWLMTRSSLIGTFVGAMPGVGGGAAHWIAYAQARATEKGAKETFGTGDIRGVIASDAANNSSDGGQLIPTLVFGIPGSGGMAILLAMIMLYGIGTGPQMLETNLDLTIGLVITIVLGNVVVVPIVLMFAPQIVKISAVQPNILAPLIIGLVTLAAFTERQSIGDLIAVAVFGALGVFMKAYGWPRPPILIAIVLIPIVERFMWLSIQNYGFSMFLRPQLLVLVAFMIMLVFASVRMTSKASGTVSPPQKATAKTHDPEELD